MYNIDAAERLIEMYEDFIHNVEYEGEHPFEHLQFKTKIGYYLTCILCKEAIKIRCDVLGRCGVLGRCEHCIWSLSDKGVGSSVQCHNANWHLMERSRSKRTLSKYLAQRIKYLKKAIKIAKEKQSEYKAKNIG